jgi:hypothetical protein
MSSNRKNDHVIIRHIEDHISSDFIDYIDVPDEEVCEVKILTNEQLADLTNIQILISKIKTNPEIAESIVNFIKIISPNFSIIDFLDGENHPEHLIELQSSFINATSQEDFNVILNKYGDSLSTKCLQELSSEKFQTWVQTISFKKLILDGTYNLIDVLAMRDLLPEDPTQFVNDFINSCQHEHPTKLFVKTLETLLITCGDKIGLDFSTIKTKAIWKIVGAYLVNKNSMLKMECETKERYIQELTAARVN